MEEEPSRDGLALPGKNCDCKDRQPRVQSIPALFGEDSRAYVTRI
jgi:hypothetical protein